MSILESLKEEKKLSLNHWRYRLLHWCFNVKVDKNTPFSYDLPRCLYTHYCPLFHLTNLIAIFSPIILIIKIIAAMVKAFVWAFSQLDFSWPTKEKVVVEPTLEELREADWVHILNCLQHPSWWDSTFENFWEKQKSSMKALTEDEVRAKFEELVPKFKEAYARAEARRKKFRDRLIFWTNFSRVFIKWVMNVVYVALVIALLYGAFLAIGPVVGFFKWLATFDPIPMFLFMGKVFIFLGVLFVVSYFLLKSKAFTFCADKAIKAGAVAAMPASLMWHVICAPSRWVKLGWFKTTEFISVFYEENCPPVTIVSEEEAKIEEVAQEVTTNA